MKNVPNINSEFGIGCTYDKDCDRYIVHSINPDGSRRLTIGEILGTSQESISNGITSLLINMREAGFEQGRKYVRDALGIEK